MITVEPMGGLCNRIRVINSAIFLAKDLGQDLTVIWRFSRGLNCSIFDLWEQPYAFAVTQYRNFDFLSKYLIRRKLKDAYFIHQTLMDSMLEEKFDFLKLRDHENIFIETWSQFYNNQDFGAFRPIPSIQSIIDQYSKDFDCHVKGVHIRRTDHVQSIKNSGTDKFIYAMKEELGRDPDVKFFLATDSKEEELRLREEFKGKVITYPKVMKRNSQKGIQDALVDLVCLSKTSKILGSYESSFSQIAAQMGNLELVIVK